MVKVRKTKAIFFIFLLVCLIFLPKISFASERTEEIEKEVKEYIKAHKDDMAGLGVAILKDDQTILQMKGFTDIEKQIKVDKDTVFEWGSTSKILIWISVMQLKEKGLLDLHTDITTYLPDEFKLPTTYETPITLMDLLNHQGGFDDSYTDLMMLPSKALPTLRQALEQMNVKQTFQPGKVVAYSNYGAALVAYIVETVSGMDYKEYVKEHIFIPLEMTQTSIDPLQQDHPWVKEQREHILGYTVENEPISPHIYAIPMYPSGSVIGTTGDMVKLAEALLEEDGALLFTKKETIDEFFSPTNFFPGTDVPRIAHGLFSLPAEMAVYGHGGNTLSFTSSFYLDRNNQVGTIVWTNQALETTFSLGIPEIVFGNKTWEQTSLVDSSVWEGRYQPARLPYHGFSKVYGMFQRTKVTQDGEHHLVTNGLSYVQQSPHVYTTEDDFSAYSVDVYMEHPTYGKMLASGTGDLFYVPIVKHIVEWGLLIAWCISIVFSVLYFPFFLVKRWRRKQKVKPNAIHFTLHFLHILLALNIVIMMTKAMSMTTYASLKVHLFLNVLYLILVGGLLLYGMVRKKFEWKSRETIFTFFVTCMILTNVLYWEFYH